LFPNRVDFVTDTRDKIRQAALKLFIDKGYSKTSIADIERAAGLAPRTGGFYRHFSSKEDLAVEIGETSIIETRRELGFDVLPLGDTKSELVLIAKGYLQAAERQAPLAALIAEVRHLKTIQALEERVNQDLLEALTSWLGEKPFARSKTEAELVALTLTIFGGWIFYLSKRGSAAAPTELTDAFMIDQWAGLWADILDRAIDRGERL
jgi:AcrR family transcriptional regulator